MSGFCVPRFASFRVLMAAGLALLASACATTTGPSSPFAMGVAASAPAGLLELCDTGGLDCPDRVDREAEAPAEATGGSAKSVSSRSPRIEDGYPNASASSPATETRIAFARFAEIERVNRMVNQRLIWRSDLEQYGVEEFWAFPIRAGLGYGDCEDFALEKRRGLIERGFPPAALALATAYSEETGLHAVLIVRTEQGDYVLDNTTPWVLPWQETPYRWLTIQAGESLTDWRLVDDPAAPTGDPDTRASV